VQTVKSTWCGKNLSGIQNDKIANSNSCGCCSDPGGLSRAKQVGNSWEKCVPSEEVPAGDGNGR